MAIVKNGQVIERAPTDDPEEFVTCDRCGRRFPLKFTYCVCKG